MNESGEEERGYKEVRGEERRGYKNVVRCIYIFLFIYFTLIHL